MLSADAPATKHGVVQTLSYRRQIPLRDGLHALALVLHFLLVFGSYALGRLQCGRLFLLLASGLATG